MKDLTSHLTRPEVVRRLRDAYRTLRGRGRFLVLVSPRLVVPDDLRKEIYVLDYDLPDEAEILLLLAQLGKRFFGEKGLVEADAKKLAMALKGLTADETEHVVSKVFSRRPVFDEQSYFEVLAEKEQATRKEGVLEFVPPRFSLDDIGGLENLKEWLLKRKSLFTKEALDAGMPIPKGILMMGMSGCGKSLSVKAISALWNLPLFRLDMNLVFGTDNPEQTFHRALRTVESLAPALLWIDEIEMAITGGREAGAGDSSLGRIFSTFLTWMQEKQGLVFVAATANRIQLLPAEVIRKGRFDQVFFIDLPNENERKAIFNVHVRKVGADPSLFDVVVPREGDEGLRRVGDRGRRPVRGDRGIQPGPKALGGRPLEDDHEHRPALEDDGRADQGHQELGPRSRDAGVEGLSPRRRRLARGPRVIPSAERGRQRRAPFGRDDDGRAVTEDLGDALHELGRVVAHADDRVRADVPRVSEHHVERLVAGLLAELGEERDVSADERLE